MRPHWLAVIFAASVLVIGHANAQTDSANYPKQPIRMLVPFAAGGGNDIFESSFTGLSGETITDMSAGDRIRFIDPSAFYGFGFERTKGRAQRTQGPLP